ncbi:TIR domain-containing protein [candidate division WOR-3 bacterium]|nr:TIR domain-containing protein [candidate division WOR-3 bacterium]
MGRVFISYAVEDLRVAQEIADGLAAAGHEPWLFTENMRPGVNYLGEICAAIDGSGAILFVVSPRSISSNQVEKEITHGFESGKPLIPVLLDITYEEFKHRSARLHHVLSGTNALSYRSGEGGRAVEQILAGLEALGVRPGRPQPRPVTPPAPEGSGRMLNRRRVALFAGIGAVLCGLVVAYLVFWRGRGPTPADATAWGTVTDAATGRGLAAEIRFTGPATRTTSSDAGSGRYRLRLPAGPYHVEARAPGFDLAAVSLELTVGQEQRHDFRLRPMQTGLQFEPVFFEHGRPMYLETSAAVLERAAGLLNANPSVNVEVLGYTDSIGPGEYNLALSQRRAQAVMQHLVTHGVAADRLRPRGCGEENPVADNGTPAGRALNNRVELKATN